MQIKHQMYENELTDILYPADGFVLKHKQTGLTYGTISLKDGRTQDDYEEIKQDDEPSED